MRARALHLEYALGALVRGEWRVEDARLEGPRIRDRVGRGRPRPSGRCLRAASPRKRFRSSGSVSRTAAPLSPTMPAARDSCSTRSNLRARCARWSARSEAKASFVAAGHRYPYRLGMSRDGRRRQRQAPLQRRSGRPLADRPTSISRSGSSVACPASRATWRLPGRSAAHPTERSPTHRGPDLPRQGQRRRCRRSSRSSSSTAGTSGQSSCAATPS